MLSSITKTLAGPVVIVIVLSAGWFTRATWKSWLLPPTETKAAEDKEPSSDSPDRVKLSEQAQRNLRLEVKEVRLASADKPYWRKIYLPGSVVDKPGHSDRGIPAPIAGVVTNVFAVPGKVVRVGDELFRLRLVSDSFQASQMELFKSTRELEIVQKERKRLAEFGSAIPATKTLELEYQADRLKVVQHAHRQDLLTRQLDEKQIGSIEKGQFVTEVVIHMQPRSDKHSPHDSLDTSDKRPVEYEVQELKVNLGDHVQAGQMLAYLSDHRHLYIEGKALKHEARLIAESAAKGWPIEAEFSEGDEDNPGERLTNLTVEFLGNTMDANGLTLPVYIPFANPLKVYERGGKTYRAGQYRPGQKVLLKVAVGKLTDVFVVPIAGVAREGPEAYVFRQNGSVFDRRSVHVLAEDTESAVIANDGSIVRGNYVAQNAAAALNRVLKASQAGGGAEPHTHSH